MTNKSIKSTFTKSIMSLVMLLYFIGALIGAGLVLGGAFIDAKLGGPLDSSLFIAFSAYIGAPTATAIGFYAWKSKAENLLKIEKGNKETTIGFDTLANMRGED